MGPLESAITVTLPNISLTALIYALTYSAVYGLTGYLNSLHDKNEAFNPRMFAKTVITGLLVAVVMIYSGIDPQQGVVSTWIFVVGNPALTTLIDKIVNDLFSLKGITITVQKAGA